MSSFYRLLKYSLDDDQPVQPRRYLAANAEILFMTICISIAITYTFNYEQLVDNPIKRMVGYNNPCVAWDAPPALYFAALFFVPTVYCAIRYAVTDSLRAFMKPELSLCKKRCILTLNVFYALSQMVCMGIFLVTPLPLDSEHDIPERRFAMRFHSTCFLQLVPMLGLAMCSNYIEAHWEGDTLSVVQWLVLTYYCLITILETVFAFQAVFFYDFDGVHVIPPTVMQAIDWGWFLSLPLAAHFQPRDPGMEVKTRVLTIEEFTSLEATTADEATCCNPELGESEDEESFDIEGKDFKDSP